MQPSKEQVEAAREWIECWLDSNFTDLNAARKSPESRIRCKALAQLLERREGEAVEAATGTKMYVWTCQPFFYAVAAGHSVSEARDRLLQEIGGASPSCPERNKAIEWIKESTPSIWYGVNAEFGLTESAELLESIALIERLEKRIKELEASRL